MVVNRGLLKIKDIFEVTTKDKIITKVVIFLKKLWNFNLFFWMWFNMVTIPLVILWPDLSD